MPRWGLVAVPATVAVSIACMLLVRRVIPLRMLRDHNDVAGPVYAVIGGVYAVLLAFVVVVVWERHTTAQTRIEQEANALGDLVQNARAFPDATRAALFRAIDRYAQVVIEEEWATMTDGRPSPAALEAYTELWQSYVQMEPASEHEALWYRTSLERLDELGDARRLRLLSSRMRVPGVLWTVLLVGGAITIAFGFLLGTSTVWSQALMVAVVSATVSLMLLLIWVLQHPFSGSAGLGPEALGQMRETIRRFAAP